MKQRLGPEAQSNTAKGRLTQAEADLLLKINQCLERFDWERYDRLIEKRQAETLTPDEHATLIALSDQLEAANADRTQHLAELARVRRISLPALMAELGLEPMRHG